MPVAHITRASNRQPETCRDITLPGNQQAKPETPEKRLIVKELKKEDT
jgi:hypothetical protein